MDLSEHPLRTPASLEELSAPGADDRWQPTRAGAVNSWAWADELFLFGDGWLAFAGPNGSGKSLTASMLITVLLDADTSQTALSTDEKAAGTLTSRHTDRNDHEDRTGSWWLEYGFRDGQTGQVDYLTTGLWLRSTSSGIQRAYFITPGRVGPDLLLQRGQEPVRVEDLAEQLATIGGDLYTNSDKVGRKAAKFLSLSGEEGDYRAAVRTRLFTGLDEVQFAALMSVLRSLRSLRTGERISPDKMRTVLTEALPALDEDGLKMIAESMERIAKHESDLERTHQEAEALAGVESRYTRYVQLVAQIEAADLQSSNREFDQMTRQTRSFTDKLATAVAVQERAREEQAANNKDLAELDGRLDGIESELRGHAGNALPERERLASSLAEQAEAATERAEQARAAAEHAGERAADSNASAEDGCSHLDGLGRELRRGGTALGAEAALDQLLAASTRVAESRPGKDLVHSIELVTDLPREQLVEPSTPRLDADAARLLTQIPKAWAEDRQRRITGVREALGHHANARSALHEASTALREAEEQEELGLQEAEATQQRRYDLEATLIQGIERWQEALQQLAPAAGPLPTSGTSPGDGDDRLQLHSVTRWVEAALSDALIRIDEPGHQQVATTSRAEAMHTAAAAATATARNQRAEADHQRAAADRTALGASQNLQADVDEQSRRAADEAHDVVLAEAEGEVAIATDAFTLSVSTADREARSWTSQLGAWLAGLSQLQLPPTELNLYKGGPDSAAPDAILTDLDHLEPALLVQAVDTAHRAVADPIRIRIVKTRPQAEQSAAALRDLEDRLAQVLAEVPAPPGPEWRDRDHTQAIPLWQTVDFAADVPEEIADRVEGALLVSGLLDALITADGQLVAGDLTITAADSAVSPSLADVLVIAADYLDDNGSDAARAEQILAAIPISAPGGDLRNGTLTIGPLTAAAPDGYRAAFIGPAARQRAQEARAAKLRANIDAACAHFAELEHTLEVLRSAEQTANSEHDSLPSPQSFVEARRDAGSQRTLLQLAKIDTTQRIAKADESHRQIQEELRRRADERRTPMLLLDQLVGQTEAAQTEAAADAAAAIEAAELAAAAQQHARDQLAEAQTAVREAHAERHGLPPLDDAIAAQKAEDRASEALTHVRAAVGFATDRHNKASHQVAEQFRELHEAAALPHGAVLPTTDRDLDTQAKAVDTFTRQVEAWQGAAHRVSDLLDRASQDSAFARTAVARADGETRTAVQARNNAVHEAEAVAEIRSLHGAEYEQLHSRRTDLGQKLRAAKQRSVELNSESTTAFGTESEARVQLSSIEPRHKLASEQRDEIVARMRRLIDEGLASITPGTGQESDPGLGRSPSNTADSTRQLPDLAAALAWAKELLADQPKGTVHKQDLETQRSKAEHWLERDVRTASSSLARYDRQVTLHSIEGTNWRRAVVADPESIQGQDLQQAVSSRRDEAAQLERDLREDMKEAMRAGLFTQLYRDINLRRQTAMELVRQIQTTLEGVRTGVAQVGVQVAWRVRDDDDAKQMVDLISRPPSDEVFDQMYTVLRQRMNEMPGESFEKRVAHAFDYRAWHQWDIEITHASFGQTAGKAVFHRVTARTNPLGSLSTGERRLATMLPLLAAAWSMYGGDSSEYTGPRLLMIDEIDAAFDEANLRQILKLLRSWRFDVVATSPSIAPLLKREAQRSVIHELVTTGRHRITIPWLWEGHGQPQLLELQPTLDEAN